jgi:hypothetical protein
LQRKAIFNAEAILKHCKTHAIADTPTGIKKAVRELEAAAEEQVTALKELLSAMEKLRQAFEKVNNPK